MTLKVIVECDNVKCNLFQGIMSEKCH